MIVGEPRFGSCAGRALPAAIAIAAVTVAAQLVLLALGLPMLFSLDNLSEGTDLGTAPTWSAIAFALPAAMLAFTGSRPLRTLQQRRGSRGGPAASLFVGIGARLRSRS